MAEKRFINEWWRDSSNILRSLDVSVWYALELPFGQVERKANQGENNTQTGQKCHGVERSWGYCIDAILPRKTNKQNKQMSNRMNCGFANFLNRNVHRMDIQTLMIRVATGGWPEGQTMGQLPFRSRPISGWKSPICLASPSTSCTRKVLK